MSSSLPHRPFVNIRGWLSLTQTGKYRRLAFYMWSATDRSQWVCECRWTWHSLTVFGWEGRAVLPDEVDGRDEMMRRRWVSLFFFSLSHNPIDSCLDPWYMRRGCSVYVRACVRVCVHLCLYVRSCACLWVIGDGSRIESRFLFPAGDLIQRVEGETRSAEHCN